MPSALLAWLGQTDLDAARGVDDGVGPIARALMDKSLGLTHVFLLNNYSEEKSGHYFGWLQTQIDVEMEIRIVHVDDRDLVLSGSSSEYSATAKALRQIADLGARVIVIDVLFLHGTLAEQKIVLEAVDEVQRNGCRIVIPVAIYPGEGGDPVLRRGLPVERESCGWERSVGD